MRFQVSTKKHEDSIDITDQVTDAVKQLDLDDGVAIVACPKASEGQFYRYPLTIRLV